MAGGHVRLRGQHEHRLRRGPCRACRRNGVALCDRSAGWRKGVAGGGVGGVRLA